LEKSWRKKKKKIVKSVVVNFTVFFKKNLFIGLFVVGLTGHQTFFADFHLTDNLGRIPRKIYLQIITMYCDIFYILTFIGQFNCSGEDFYLKIIFKTV